MPTLSRNNPFAQRIARVRTWDESGEILWKRHEIWWTQIVTDFANAGPGHKYPYKAGQTIEWTGAEPLVFDVESEWWGDGWQDRLDALLLEIRTSPFGQITIPDGPVCEVFARSGRKTQLADQDGASVTLRFEENSHADWHETARVDDLTAAAQALPAGDRGAAGGALDSYVGRARNPGRYSTGEIQAALRDLDTRLRAIEMTLDLRTMDGVRHRDALLMVRYHAVMAAPPGVRL